MNDIFRHLLRDATQLAQEGRLTEATGAIQRALESAQRSFHEAAGFAGGAFGADTTTATSGARAGGRFISGRCTHAGAERHYKLYVPAGHAAGPQPLVVMLHGCAQNPDDFAAGTGMNALADESGFLVLYPAQSQADNPQGCWNWFEQTHQQRGGGEPAVLAAMTQAVIQEYDIDAHRVFIAGMSAGGAMADIVATAYPDIFAAVGVHSGVPCGAASNVAEAFSVMANGVPDDAPAVADGASAQRAVPIIVFHGDNDRMVHPRNGEQVIEAALRRTSAGTACTRVEEGASEQGRRYTRTTHDGHDGEPVAEHWLVHGAGHTWSGGQPQGSGTDTSGPDATREMLRFFFAQPKGPGRQARSQPAT